MSSGASTMFGIGSAVDFYQSYMKFGIYKNHTDQFSKQHKGNPPDCGETNLYYDAIAVGNTCADLNLKQEEYSCSSFED